MKKVTTVKTIVQRREILVCGFGLIAASCSSGGSPGASSATPAPTPMPAPTPTPTPTGTLTVVSGIQAATQTPGATLDVFADADPAGQVFDKWTGGVASLQTAGERRSGTLPLTTNTTVTATYKPLAAFTPNTTILNRLAASDPAAVNAYWHFPSVPLRGLILRFHGSGGNGGSQFTKIEELKFARDSIGSGFAVASLDSNDRVGKSWDQIVNQSNPAASPDVANIQKLIAMFVTLGLMLPSTPVFGSGHSDGAGAALRFAFLLNWKASHQHCVPGSLAIAQATTVPGIWTMAQNDTLADPNRNASAKINSDALAGHMIATSYIIVAPSAVYSTRFSQIPGISTADSAVIYTSLKTASLLDAKDYQTTDPTTVNFTPIIPPQFSAFGKDIVDQLNVAYTAHQFSSATSRRVLDFFVARLG